MARRLRWRAPGARCTITPRWSPRSVPDCRAVSYSTRDSGATDMFEIVGQDLQRSVPANQTGTNNLAA
jgi:hypothetical protein